MSQHSYWLTCHRYDNDTELIGHTHTHPFNGPMSGTTRVSRYQEGKTNLDFTGARDSEWQWHQLGRMQVCTSLQTDNHASTPPLRFFTGRMPFLPPNHQRQSTEGTNLIELIGQSNTIVACTATSAQCCAKTAVSREADSVPLTVTVTYIDIAVRSLTCHTATGTHMPYRITQCYLPPNRGDIPVFTPAEAGTRLSNPGRMRG